MIPTPEAALPWWHELQPTEGRRGDRATLARLRRCATVAEAMQEPATMALFRRVGATGPHDLPPVALAAAVLAHVGTDVPGGSVARLIGPSPPDQPDTALVKSTRLRRLMELDDLDDRLTAFRRLVGLARGTLPVADLARALMDWTDDRKRRWIYDYWDAGRPADPAADPTPSKDTAG